MQELFFELLRISNGTQQSFSREISAQEWAQLLSICKGQALLGFCFDGIGRLPKEQTPPQDVLLKWMALANIVHKRNEVLNNRCAQLMEMLTADGFKPVILKGQGNSLMYPNPLARQCGDIDVWLDADEDTVRKYVMDRDKGEHHYSVHHIDYNCFPDVMVEMHFALGKASDSLFSNRFYNWFSKMRQNTYPSVTLPNGKNIVVPSLELNLVHQMVHIDQHFGPGGIGMRQILDYYYLLHEAHRQAYDFAPYRETLQYLKLSKIGGALMYVLKHVLGMDEVLMPLPINEKEGKFFLEEVLAGGNFGFGRKAKTAGMSTFRRRSRNLVKNLRFLPHFPGNALRHYYKAIKGMFSK